jgi:hypothetical protein
MESISADFRRGIPWVVAPFLGVVLLRLALEPGYFTGKYAVLIALPIAFGLVHAWLARESSPWRIRAAVLVNFAAVNIGYLWIGVALNDDPGWRADDLVYAIDRTVFAGDPQRFLARISAPWLSTVTMLGYLGFAGLLFYLFLSEAFVLTRATGRVQLGLMCLYGLGFSTYVLLPAAGPAFHHPARLPPIQHSAFSARLQPWVLGNCSQVDVCPSIHAAICAFALVWTFTRRRWLFWLLLPPCLALLLGTVYLQYHYFLDLPCGLLLGTAAALSVSHAEPRPSVHAPAGSTG